MINTIAWSKDRAAQLDLTLSTYKKYFVDWKGQVFSIIYTASNERFNEAYEKVKKYHPEFKWIRETNFRANTISCFNDNKRPYTSFLVDDDVFIDYFSLNSDEFKLFETDPNIICLSPRMAPYMNYCYTANINTPPPTFSQKQKVWNWKDGSLKGDWSYPWSVSCHHIFKTEDLTRAVNTIPFRLANSFEGTCLVGHINEARPLMICFETAKAICGANNKVQNENQNRHENSHSLESLNNAFLQGKRLCPDINHQIKTNACHGPVQLKFI